MYRIRIVNDVLLTVAVVVWQFVTNIIDVGQKKKIARHAKQCFNQTKMLVNSYLHKWDKHA